MASVSWTSTASGNWNTAGDWSGGVKPGATSDVLIEQSSITVTYSTGTDSILSLTTGYENTLDVTGGSLAVLGNSTLSGAVDQSGGTLSLGGKQSVLYEGIQQTKGTLKIASGTAVLEGTGSSIAGTVTGATLDCQSGAITLAATASISTRELLLAGATVTLAGKLSDSGLFEQTEGTLSIGSQLLLSGTAGLAGGSINGSGLLDLTGTTELDGINFDGSGSVDNTGKLVQDGILYIDYGTGSASITNSATGTWTILGNDTVFASTATTNPLVKNLGTLDVTGSGTSQIDPSFANTGKITIQTGTLVLQGEAESLSGSIGGAGTLELYDTATTTLAKSLSLSVANVVLQDGTIDLGASLAYAGTLDFVGGSLVLGADTLTLSGVLNMSAGTLGGSGKVVTSGSSSVGGVIDGSVLLQNSGTLAIGSLTIGENSGDSAELQNLASGTLVLTNSSIYTQSGDMVNNAGTLDKTGTGTADIYADLASSGTVTVAAGELILGGASAALSGVVAGAGTLAVQYGTASGTTTIGSGTTLGVAALTLSDATLAFAASESYAGSFTMGGGTLSLGTTRLTLSGDDTLQGGTITAAIGGTLALSGDTSMLGGWYAEGGVVLYNTGTITSLDSWELGSNAAGTASLDNAAGGSVVIGDIYVYANAGASIVNAGTISKSLGGNGNGNIYAAVTNTGEISVSQGTLSFLGAVTGTGVIAAGAGTELSFAASVSGGTVSLGAYTDLALNTNDGFADKISGFAAGDTIELNGLYYNESSTAFTFTAATDKLAVTNGSSSITLALSGSYTSASFSLFNDDGVVGIAHT